MKKLIATLFTGLFISCSVANAQPKPTYIGTPDTGKPGTVVPVTPISSGELQKDTYLPIIQK